MLDNAWIRDIFTNDLFPRSFLPKSQFYAFASGPSALTGVQVRFLSWASVEKRTWSDLLQVLFLFHVFSKAVAVGSV